MRYINGTRLDDRIVRYVSLIKLSVEIMCNTYITVSIGMLDLLRAGNTVEGSQVVKCETSIDKILMAAEVATGIHSQRQTN